jgi:hypothetical protein
MEVKTKPKTKLGKWSVGLNIFFLVVITASIILVKFFGILNFNDTWWDITVPVSFSASIIALVTGIIAIGKKEERSILVYLSIIVSMLVILFIFLHSLWISD